MLYADACRWPVDYEPYTASHVLAQTQLLVFSALAFSWLMRNGIYPPELRSVNLDVDWLYRGLGLRVARGGVARIAPVFRRVRRRRRFAWASRR